MPTRVWPLPAATAIGRWLGRAANRPPIRGVQTRAGPPGAKAGRFLKIGIVLVYVACATAFGVDVLEKLDAPQPDGRGVVTLAVPPC